ncbi:TPA: hypothetical protein UOK25_000395 [Stenotrophomonas maltophilia]|uniref:hypothetical protein n=1 Tax=Stenotrophomonas maltophilia TaxID=40324 RepID=UPI002555EA43|nr:hypothetical protein [Stenotrophomonas maltophilia]HEL5571671.1 hypothetical protein [Stenotrophomonas maltophilia]
MKGKYIITRRSTFVCWIAIVVLVQLLITQWTVKAAGSREIVDYISFAGTVIGIVLALLAIVYAFLTNASQKNDSDNLKAQITRLDSTITSAGISGQKFDIGVSRLESIIDGVASLEKHTMESAARVEAGIDSIRSAVKINEIESSRSNPLGSDVSADAKKSISIALRRLIDTASEWQTICYYTAALAPSDVRERVSFFNETINRMLKSKVLSSYMSGQMHSAYWLLFDLGLTGEGSMDGGLSHLAERAKVLIDRFDTTAKDETWDRGQVLVELKKISDHTS